MFIPQDDFMDGSFSSPVVESLFGRVGTHFHIDVAVLSQFGFSRAKYFQVIISAISNENI